MKTRPSHRTILSIVAVALAWLPTELHAQFAYVANADSNDVSGYRIDSTTGALTPIPGSPFAAGLGPSSVAVDPAGRFAYVANRDSADVSGYTINAPPGRSRPSPDHLSPQDQFRTPWPWTRVAGSPTWRMEAGSRDPATFRRSRLSPLLGRSRPSPGHPSRQERLRCPWPSRQ